MNSFRAFFHYECIKFTCMYVYFRVVISICNRRKFLLMSFLFSEFLNGTYTLPPYECYCCCWNSPSSLLAMWLNLHECSYNNNGIKIELMTMEFRKNWIYGDVIQIFWIFVWGFLVSVMVWHFGLLGLFWKFW